MFTLALLLISVARRLARAESRRCWEGLVLLGREGGALPVKDFWVGVVVVEEWRCTDPSQSSGREVFDIGFDYLLYSHPACQTWGTGIFLVIALLGRAAGLLAPKY